MERVTRMTIELRLSEKAIALLICMVCIVVLSSCSGDETDDSAGDRPTDSGIENKAGMNAPGRGKSIRCLACHGAEGISDYDVWPNLAGQNTAYLAKQMRDFRAGHRHDPWMSPMAGPLSDQDIDDLAGYFNTAAARVGDAGAVEPAIKLQAESCTPCHGAKGRVDNPLWPNLAGQNARYLVKQLQDFRAGRRVDPVMAPMAQALTDQDIKGLAAFYAGL